MVLAVAILIMRKLSIPDIIHLFAFAHALITLSCRYVGMDDTLVLTMLTMMMTVIICMRRGLSVEFTAVSVIAVNIAGFAMGIGGGYLFGLFMDSELLVHPLSSLITTEIMGWVIFGFTRMFRTELPEKNSVFRLRWIVIASLAVFVLRFGYMEVFSRLYGSSDEVWHVLGKFLSNAPVLIVVLCLNLIYVRSSHKTTMSDRPVIKIFSIASLILVLPMLMAATVWFGLPFSFDRNFGKEDIFLYFLVATLVELVLYSVLYMIDYAMRTRSAMVEQKEKADMAEYRYFKLKQQLNPHFLFNSLNILDGLVVESRPEQASEYIHKLADVYRYMLRNETEELVTLRDEMVFVGMYSDLLRVRFSDGFSIATDIREEDLRCSVVPCSIQLLVENAIKHNVVGGDRPLEITISSDGVSVTVSNVLIPKMTAVQSTGVGQKYLNEEYLRRTGRPVVAYGTGHEYVISLPLL